MVSSGALYVEGGGDSKALRIACRRAFTTLLERAGMRGRRPRIIPCGSRRHAYDDFCRALGSAAAAPFLLVDAEAPVEASSPWEHVKSRPGDRWTKPKSARDDQLHLMVQCMEAWLLADRAALVRFYGSNLQQNALPRRSAPIEKIAKNELLGSLERATKPTKTKGLYDKGRHSFKLLEALDPALVRRASPWAERFFATLDRLLPR